MKSESIESHRVGINKMQPEADIETDKTEVWALLARIFYPSLTGLFASVRLVCQLHKTGAFVTFHRSMCTMWRNSINFWSERAPPSYTKMVFPSEARCYDYTIVQGLGVSPDSSQYMHKQTREKNTRKLEPHSKALHTRKSLSIFFLSPSRHFAVEFSKRIVLYRRFLFTFSFCRIFIYTFYAVAWHNQKWNLNWIKWLTCPSFIFILAAAAMVNVNIWMSAEVNKKEHMSWTNADLWKWTSVCHVCAQLWLSPDKCGFPSSNYLDEKKIMWSKNGSFWSGFTNLNIICPFRILGSCLSASTCVA